ncbi:MAG: hypothetical protein OEX04_14580 [Acidimicrobiia bacterium]|nr:hypothetical protein [Acidimicrobiia bacterium]MDH4308692.1 hypothetical protein [Acidimicrobiia bacterium]MDH5292766.1 hypothetical protein [Acidimicrobiia bacterium]
MISPAQPTSRAVERLLTSFIAATLLALTQLFVFPDQTSISFAWTINPELSAAFMGAGFGAGFILVLRVRDRPHWAEVRLSYATILAFTIVTLGVTLAHLDSFHFDAGGWAEVAAWIWLAVYVTAPIAMTIVGRRQLAAPGVDPPIRHPMPAWLRSLLLLESAVMVGYGIALLIAPSGMPWPWPLTPLVGRAIAAWLIPLGIAAWGARRELDLARLKEPALAFVVFAALALVAIGRFSDQMDWASPSAYILVLWLLVLAATGIRGVLPGGREPRRPASPIPSPPPS